MKTLKESILGSTNTGKNAIIRQKIEEWCKENKIFNGEYKINKDNTISCKHNDGYLCLDYKNYTKLPDYINFADDKNLTIVIGICGFYHGHPYRVQHAELQQIDSFNGLPSVCHRLYILTSTNYLPEIKIKASVVRIDFGIYITKCKGIYINFYEIGALYLRDYEESFDKLHINNVKIIDMVNDFHYGDLFSKAMARKAPMNKYRNKYEFPVTGQGIEVIKTFFGKTIDISQLKSIEYTQNSKLVKIKDTWYRCKNW